MPGADSLDPRRYALTTIERHRLNQFIALHRARKRIPQPQRYAVMQVIALYKARSKILPSAGKPRLQRHRAGRKRITEDRQQKPHRQRCKIVETFTFVNSPAVLTA